MTELRLGGAQKRSNANLKLTLFFDLSHFAVWRAVGLHPICLTRSIKIITLSLFIVSSLCQGDEESFTLKSCTRRKTDSIEKRFCFDVEAVDRSVSWGFDSICLLLL